MFRKGETAVIVLITANQRVKVYAIILEHVCACFQAHTCVVFLTII